MAPGLLVFVILLVSCLDYGQAAKCSSITLQCFNLKVGLGDKSMKEECQRCGAGKSKDVPQEDAGGSGNGTLSDSGPGTRQEAPPSRQGPSPYTDDPVTPLVTPSDYQVTGQTELP
ncbi:hypothetical protein HDE_09299 [Halotydeus destructor]|nr:hypothetical protein HDE_10010 [Halotydeus destructor]KAI1288443.1 hypothetical protein HDE_09299 [Halotydeus destructor]